MGCCLLLTLHCLCFPFGLLATAVGVVFVPYRYIALILLMVQTTAVILTIRYLLSLFLPLLLCVQEEEGGERACRGWEDFD